MAAFEVRRPSWPDENRSFCCAHSFQRKNQGESMPHPLTQITTEYIMTLHCPLDPPHAAVGDLQIFNARTGGWVRGPAIRGEVIAPSGDWLRISPGGARKLDVRLTIKAEDGGIIYMSYTGRSRAPDAAALRLEGGETLGPDQLYFIIAPTFETAAVAHAWLNDTVAVGKIVSVNRKNDRHVTYDIFAVR
jgi:hypothetical protein